MKTNRTVLIKLTFPPIVKGSTRGCGRRYVLRGDTPQGEWMRVETNPTSESNWTCDIHKQTALIFRVAVREVGVATPIANRWESSASSGQDHVSEFANQQAIAATKEQDHGE